MEREDPFEMLARLRPHDADAPLRPGDDPTADELLQSILSSPTPRLSRRRRRRVVAAMTVVGVVGGGAVAAAVWLDRPSDPATLSCYSDASIDPDEQVGLLIDPDRTPIDQCVQVWVGGPLGTDGAPPLVACVTSGGITAVVPGDADTCAQLGLASLDPEVDEDDDVGARVVSELSAKWPDTCVATLGEATALVEQILSDVGAEEWAVAAPTEPSPDAPCVVTSPDPAQMTVFLVPIPAAPER